MELTSTPLITIGIPTYRRPLLLSGLLESIRACDWRKAQPEIIVVDNDPDGSGFDTATRHSDSLRIRYISNTARNMAAVLNQIIDETKSDVLVLLDDDMEVDPDFATHLLQALSKGSGDAAAWLCHTEVRFTDDVPALHRYLFQRSWKRFDHLEIVPPQAMHSGGSILFLPVILGYGIRFDQSMALIGGYDTAFFTHLAARGAIFRFFPQLITWEITPAERASPADQLRRALSTGVRMHRLNRTKGARLPLELALSAMKGLAAIVVALGILPVSPRRSFGFAIKAVCKFSYVASLLGFNYEYYR